MKIVDSNVSFSSSHEFIQHHERHRSLVVTGKAADEQVVSAAAPADQGPGDTAAGAAVTVSLSGAARGTRSAPAVAPPVPETEKPVADLNMRILKLLFEKIFGREIKVVDPGEFRAQADDAAAAGDPARPGPERQEAGWGIAYDFSESRYEYEATSFSARGVIRTADGREIGFTAELIMSREFAATREVHLRAGDALKDPLVVNFDAAAAELNRTTFSFDIDADGRTDQIAFVRSGSGFLALDRNGDGTINDGGELFGALDGDGFRELATYDADGNGWIDENDAVYDRLRIWTRDREGNDRLLALGAKGIGAIYLGHVDTPFALKDDSGTLQGQVRSSGIFLGEDGRVGTIQQLDLVA